MWVRLGRILLAAMTAAVLVSGGSAQAQHAPDVKRVLDRARAASGGAAWSKVAGLHEVGSETGLRYERWVDPLRYGVRTEVQTPAGKVVRGYNGYGAWSLLPVAADRSAEAAPVLADALSNAFFAAYGYFFPSRFDVRSAYVGVRNSDGRAFDVLRLHPNGGRAREVWFDRRTGLAGRMVETSGEKPLTVEMSDYRRVGALMVPFRYTTYGGDLPRPQVRQAEAIDVRRLDREMFSLPRPKGP